MALSSVSKHKLLPTEEMDEENVSFEPRHKKDGYDNDVQRTARVIEKQRSVTDIELGMGTKKVSLYLSRPTSHVSDLEEDTGLEHTTGSASSANKQQMMPSFHKEFTFTGYDIMSDNDHVHKDKTYQRNNTSTDVQLYVAACKLFGIIPVNYIIRHINDKELTMKSHPLGSQGTQAICIPLVRNTTIEKLDFEDNDIGTEGAISVADMLKENITITEVRLSENRIGSGGALAFAELLKEGKNLHTLDISGSGLEDSDSKIVADMIEFNSHLKVLNISHNRLSEAGAFDIGRAMVINDTMQELNLSWNHIRGKGAMAIAMGIQKNVALKKIDLSWNGFGKDGSIGLGRALEENRTLRVLDVSNNRIGTESIGFILKGLQQNDGLDTLKIGQNPFSPEVAMTILKAIEQSDKCLLTTLDITDVVVRTDFIQLWDEIKAKRSLPLRIQYGAVVKSTTTSKGDLNIIDWRDPVMRMFKYMHDKGYRVIDLLKRLDRDRSLTVDRLEFKQGLQAEGIPLTEFQLDEVIERLDTDKDGELDLGELILAEKDYRRKMRIRMKKLLQLNQDPDTTLHKLFQMEEL